MSIKFEFLPVEGDAILITTEDFVMLIDGGGKSTYQRLKTRLELLDRPIDLVILTHIDEDHIFGLIKLFENIKYGETTIKVKKIWFNSLVDKKLEIDSDRNNTDSPKISRRQAKDLSQLLKDLSYLGIEHINNDICCDKSPCDQRFSLTETLEIRLLSPTKDSLSKMYKAWDPKLFAKQNMKISHANDYHLEIQRLMNA